MFEELDDLSDDDFGDTAYDDPFSSHQSPAAAEVEEIENEDAFDSEEDDYSSKSVRFSPRKQPTKKRKRTASTTKEKRRLSYPEARAPPAEREWATLVLDRGGPGGTRATGLSEVELQRVLHDHSEETATGLGYSIAGKKWTSRADGSAVQLQRCRYSKQRPPCPAMRRIIRSAGRSPTHTVEVATSPACSHQNHQSSSRATGLPGNIRGMCDSIGVFKGAKTMRAELRDAGVVFDAGGRLKTLVLSYQKNKRAEIRKRDMPREMRGRLAARDDML